nr:hypothetical protein GCM10025732_55410 [Glycomyces mayteni]
MFALLGIALAAMGIGVASAPLLITVVILAGLFLGVLNTALTETVMEATDLPRGVASSTYSGVRFLGGAIAPAVTGAIAAAWGDGAPYWFAVAALAVAIAVLATGRRTLAHLTRPRNTAEAEAQLITVGDEV